MEIELFVPFAEKDYAKEIARAAGGRLLWNRERKVWRFEGGALPKELERFRKALPGGRPKFFVLDIPWPLKEFALERGARWLAKEKLWVYRGTELPPALAPFRAPPWSREAHREDALNNCRRPPVPPREAIELRPHQQKAVEMILAARKAKRPGFLVADEVGLGKTYTAIAAVLSMPDVETVLVTAPASVCEHWRQALLAMGDGGKLWTIVSVDSLQHLFEISPERQAKVKSRKGVARHGAAARFDVMIADEAHKFSNPAAARSKLAAKIQAEAGFTIWMSATPGSDPLRLSFAADLLAAVTGSRCRNLKDWEKWCAEQGLGVKRGAFGRWESTGDEADCLKMHKLLFGGRVPAGIRRRPEDIAGWPEIQIAPYPAALDPAARRAYGLAWEEFCRDFALPSAGPRGKDSRNAIVKALRLRQASSLLRVPSTAAFAADLVSSGQHVAISVYFQETLERLREACEKAGLEVATIHGKQSGREKEAERQRFQSGEADIVIFSVVEGISLHDVSPGRNQPRSQINHDLRWSAIEQWQIFGRTHRDGQFSRNYLSFAIDTVEEKIVKAMLKRLGGMSVLLDGQRREADLALQQEIEEILVGAMAAPRLAA